jgi:arylformamidase
VKLIDISPEIHSGLGVWPGDTPFSREVLMDTDQGDHLGLSKITSTLHLGAHTDAPNHYAPQSPGISQRSLDYYFGPVQVIEVNTERGQRILWEHLKTQEIKAPRVLFKTGSFPDPEQWNNDFCALSPELVEVLAQKHVLLVGIDTPSVDLFECKELLSHKVIHQNNMAILEGVVLEQVDPGLYTLCALPLKIRDADASPVRAVLLELS